jgi:16S rRNA A1518/A1519 N6-dimethyltransferase RsmA/KsgA/DIM1 with predicted DNA glycosylase/AP lyase activity
VKSRRDFLPAAGRDWLLPFYDPFVWLVGGERARRALLDQAAIGPTHRVLDIGCGTGTLAVLIKRLHPDVAAARLHRLFARLFHSKTHPHEDEDRLLALLRDAGFADPKVVERRSMLFTPLAYYQAGR